MILKHMLGGLALIAHAALLVSAQEADPKLLDMPIQTCTAAGCIEEKTKLTLDANWRWYYHPSNYQNCFDNGYTCTNDQDCSDCVITGLNDGDYDRYGITTANGALTMSFADNPAGNIGARLYLMNAEGSEYRGVDHTNPLEAELSIDVEIGSLGCGLNGAIYYSEMLLDGGKARDGNQGAAYGTGYCDAQCPKDLHHVDGKVNWRGEAQCCNEMDIWEANSISNAFTPHTCTGFNPFSGGNDETQPMVGPVKCVTDGECGISDRYATSMCDKDGCDLNQFRMGNTEFYGPGKTVDTTQKFTMTTQFISDSDGDLVEIRRHYYQRDGRGILRKIDSPPFVMNGKEYDSITDDMCFDQKSEPIGANAGGFGSESTFLRKGGNKAMGESFKRGMVLIFSIWDDMFTNMSWLDSDANSQGLPGLYGQGRGTCQNQQVDRSSAASKNAQVTYSNVRIGTIGSTGPLVTPSAPTPLPTAAPPSPTAIPPAPTTTPPTPFPTASAPPTSSGTTCAARWQACTDDHTSCCSGLVCHVQSKWYAQCLSSVGAPTTVPTTTATVAPQPTLVPGNGGEGGSGCATAVAYTPSAVYGAGDVVLFNGRLYSAMWYSKGTPPSAGAPWEFVEVCDSTLLQVCGGVPAWNSQTAFRKGQQTNYESSIYEAKWWSSGTPPPQANSWSLVGRC